MVNVNKYRTHMCSELNEMVGNEVRVAGFVENIRDHGGVIFVDVRDMSGQKVAFLYIVFLKELLERVVLQYLVLLGQEVKKIIIIELKLVLLNFW